MWAGLQGDMDNTVGILVHCIIKLKLCLSKDQGFADLSQERRVLIDVSLRNNGLQSMTFGML